MKLCMRLAVLGLLLCMRHQALDGRQGTIRPLVTVLVTQTQQQASLSWSALWCVLTALHDLPLVHPVAISCLLPLSSQKFCVVSDGPWVVGSATAASGQQAC
jgi:hypothetical protein